MAPPSDLERRLRELDSRVRVVPLRHLLRVRGVLADRGIPFATSLELALPATADVLREADVSIEGGAVVLLAAPDDRLLDDPEHTFTRYARAVERFRFAESLPPPAVDQLLPHARRELRFVLEADHLLPYGAADSDLATAAAVAAADLAGSDRDRDVFPSAPSAAEMLKTLALDHSPFPQRHSAARARSENTFSPDPAAEPAAMKAARRGNAARAASLFARAGNSADADRVLQDGLVAPLAAVLGWDATATGAWFEALRPLPANAAAADWHPAAKCLHDLQTVVADFRQPLFAVAPVPWLLSGGKKPLRRPLEPVRDILLARRLTSAAGHAAAAGQGGLAGKLEHEARGAADRARAALGPQILAAFDGAGLVPSHPAEAAARGRIVAELLDGLCDRGHLRFTDVRDAVARNNLKLPDVASVGEWLRGDALLRLDRTLSDMLFGVYHGAEVYLRAIQRFSAAGFGTPAGRAVSLYAALPFGGAFLALEAVQHLWHAAEKLGGVFRKAVAPPVPELDVAGLGEAAAELATAPPPAHAGFVHWYTVLPLGLLILALIHSPPFRAAVLAWLGVAGRFLKAVLFDAPAGLYAKLRRLKPVRTAVRYGGWPLAAWTASAVVLAAAGAPFARVVWWPLIAALITTVGTNSKWGRAARERLSELCADAWRQVAGSLVPGVIAFVQSLFAEVLAAVDRALYAVDEALRFREGASEPSVALRAVAAAVWFPVAYAVRFGFYLLFEPQVNPVKHFPVVTVSHKLLLPLIPSVASGLRISEWWAGLFVGLVPGVFGFLVWELKENWRLYAANRPRKLPAAAVGHHGETVRRLLRPGFHAGTVPKLYRKLRAGWLTGDPAPHAATARHDLHHLAEAVRLLIEREVLPLWANAGIYGVSVHVAFGVQAMRVEFRRGGEPMVVRVENFDDTVRGEVVAIGWAKELPAEQQGIVDAGVGALLTLAAAADGAMEWERWKAYWK